MRCGGEREGEGECEEWRVRENVRCGGEREGEGDVRSGG